MLAELGARDMHFGLQESFPTFLGSWNELGSFIVSPCVWMSQVTHVAAATGSVFGELYSQSMCMDVPGDTCGCCYRLCLR